MKAGRPAGVCLLTFAAVAVAGGAGGFWLCLPGALLLAVPARSVVRALGGALLPAIAAAGAVALSGGSLPQVPLVAIVVALSATVGHRLHARARRGRDGLRAAALTDGLTGAANRRALWEFVDYEVARHDRLGHSFAVLALDLGGFEQAGERVAYPAQDELLSEVAAALARAVRDQDTVARTGRDEFCVLAPETERTGAERLAERVGVTVSRVTAGLGTGSASVGIGLFPTDGASAEEVLAAAAAARIDAKPRSQPARRAA